MNAFKPLVLFILFVLVSITSNAAIVPYTRGLLKTPDDISTRPYVNTSSGDFTASINPVWTGLSYVDQSKRGVITFGVNHHFPTLGPNFRALVKLKVTKYATLSSSGVVDTITLEISNYPEDSLSFLDKKSVVIENVEKFDVSLILAQLETYDQAYLRENLYIQGDVYVDRIYDFTGQLSNHVTIRSDYTDPPLDLDCDTSPDEFVISWDPVEGAEEYQVEWVYINDYDKSIGDLSVDFRLNSTRISTSQTNYHLSLVFDKGYICYRVRSVGRSMTDVSRFLFSPWSTSDGPIGVSSCYYYQQTTPFDELKNWQYSSTYAEEGKKKEVVSFFDGSLRNRQMVTKINTDHTTIVGETIYDHQGRPAIQVLPVPVSPTSCDVPDAENSLKFYEKFNRKDSTNAYTKLDFDTSATGDSCSTVLSGMDVSSGASNYYSSSNTENEGIQGYLPDAQNFPFSQVEYTPDNTGRISRQGGVGPEFQLGSGHETKYFYGHPFQEQLDRLFGSEVGDYSHYQKNMVIDPNGQVSISYLDQEGRVIATSLAGEAPDNLISLESAAEAGPLTVDLFSPNLQGQSSSNILGVDGKSKIFNQSVLLSSKTTLEIHYDLNVTPFIDTCMSPDSSVCFNCIYDLQIEVRDICGQLVSPAAVSNKLTGHFELDSVNQVIFTTDCESFGFDTTFIIDSLPVGSYQISKILTVNEDAIEAYVAMYVNDSLNLCKPGYDELLEEQQLLTDNECDDDFSCQECIENLGTLVDYITAGGTEDEYNAAFDACNAPCTPISFYQTMREIMKGDVLPGGQYGEYTINNGTIQTSMHPLSVLNVSNILPKEPVSDWKSPKYDIEPVILEHYYESDGATISRIFLQNVVLASNLVLSSSPEVDPASTLGTKVFLDAATNEYYTYPQYLKNVGDFINYYGANPYWANSLIFYHPEYPILKYYRTHTTPVTATDRFTSESFDNDMMEVNTWDDAVDAGFIKSNYLSLPVNSRLDDFMTDSTGTVWDPFAYYDPSNLLEQKVALYKTINGTNYSMMEFAAMTTRCQNLPLGSMPGSSCKLWGSDYGLNATENELIRDQEWMAFRSLYFSEKQKIQQAIVQDLTLTDVDYYGYNACIGNIDFNRFANGFFHWIYIPGTLWSISGQFLNQDQPCSYTRFAYYENKQIRFGYPADLMNQSPQNVAYQLYLVTGQCPNASALQSVLNEAVETDKFDDASFSLNSLGSFSGMLLSLNDFDTMTVNQNMDWVQTSITTNILEVLWSESGNAYATVQFTRDLLDTVGYAWSDIVSFSNLDFTTINSGFYEFKITAKVIVGGITYFVPIHGKTTLPIGNCTFDDVCEKNDLGRDMELLAGLVTGFEILDDVTPFNISDLPAFDNFITDDILDAVSLNSPGELSWQFDPASPCFKITNSANSDYLRLGINSFSPSTFTIANMSLIKSIEEIVVGQNNTFQLICNDVSGNYLVTINCDAVRVAGGLQAIPFGDCGLPTPLLCEGEPYQTLDDLEVLFADVLVHQNAPFDLYNTTELTSTLETQISTEETEIEGLVSLPGGGIKVLTFDFPTECDLTLTYDSIPGLNFSFDSIVAVGEMELSGEVNNFGSYYNFNLTTSVSINGSLHTVILKGESCLRLKECISCTEEPAPISYTASELDSISDTLILSGVLIYQQISAGYMYYQSVVSTGNTNLGLSPSDPDYIVELSYYEYYNQIYPNSAYEYQLLIQNFVPELESYYLLQHPGEFFSTYGQFTNLSLSYFRYTNAIASYNAQRLLLGYDQLTPVSLAVFTTLIYSTDCTSYLNYLAGHINDPSASTIITNYPDSTTALLYSDSVCMTHYQDYLSAFLDYLSENTSCTGQPLSYTQFESHNLCCTSLGLDDLAAYISLLDTSTMCGLELPFRPGCSTFEEDTSLCAWNLNGYYFPKIAEFNASPWAIANNVVLDYEYTSGSELYLDQLCDCPKLYNAHIQPYIDAEATDILPMPLTMAEYCKPVIPVIHYECEEAYSEYLRCIALFNDHALENETTEIQYIISESSFYENNLCNCVDAYCAELNLVTAGLKDFDLMPNLLTFCIGDPPPCTDDSLSYEIEEPFITEFNDPCTEFYETSTAGNAYITYQEQNQALMTDLSSRYIQHCLGALENMSMTYDEIEHHFTLYYYDQAGNLIKTVPPEGVEFVDIADPDVAQAILEDRAYNTHQVITSHRMQTTYLYNSLNQLVAQNMPDQDEMQVFEATLPNGLPKQLTTTAIQMVNSNQGYLAGFIDNASVPLGSRGYLFSTNNGGQNWVRVNNTIASDLKRVRMLNSTDGFAVGSSGVLILTSDGGASWDLVDTYSSNIQEDFVSLELSTTDAYVLTKSGKVFKCTAAGVISSFAVAPTNTLYTVNEFKDFSLQNNYASATGILYIASLNDGTNDFDAILLNAGSSLYTLEKVLVSDLNSLAFYTNSAGVTAGLDGNLSLLSGTSSSDFLQTMKVSGTVAPIDQIHMLNEQIGVARMEENGVKVIRKTANGGVTWLPLSNNYPDANLSFIKRSGTSNMEVLVQGYSSGTAYSKTILMASNGTISELNQTPVAAQNIDLKVVYAYNNGTYTTVFGIDGSDQLYRSNSYGTAGSTLNFTLLSGTGTLPADPKQLIVLKDGANLSVNVLLTNGTVYKTSYDPLLGSIGAYGSVSGPGSLIWMDKITLSSVECLLGYNSSDSQIYGKTVSTGTLYSFATTLSLGTSVISKIAVHGNQLTLVGTKGGIFTSGTISAVPTSTGGQPISFTARQDHRLPALNSIRKLSSNLLITGDNGLLISRAISTSASTASVKPLQTLSDLNAANEFVSSSITYYLVGGSNGYFSQFHSSTFAETTLYTSSGLTVSDHALGASFNDIAVANETVYVVGDNGSVYFTPSIVSDFFLPAVHLTSKRLTSVAFYGTSKAVVVGDATEMIRYTEHMGTLNNRIFSSKYRDVHFANAQYGTVIGDHFLVRTTTDGGLSWKISLPGSALTLNSTYSTTLRKVWTLPGTGSNHSAIIGFYHGVLSLINNGVFSNTSIPGRVSDIQFSANSPLKGYFTYNHTPSALRKITVSSLPGGTYSMSVSSDLLTDANLIHAIHVFENQSVAYTGSAGEINYFNKSDSTTYNLATISGVSFNDIYFHDNIVGYAAGDAGKWYHLSSYSNDNLTHDILGINYSDQPIEDPEIGSGTDYNILAMAFNSRTTGVYGGYYTDAGYVTGKKAMVRILRHEGGMYTARFYYDRLGRIVTSQNSRQLVANKFSYTLYDELGRVYEAGEKEENGSSDPQFASIFGTTVGGVMIPSVIDDVKLQEWLDIDATATRKEVTRSYYDVSNASIASSLPITLTEATQRKRIVHVTYEAEYDGHDDIYDHATHYEYDIHGNVQTILQENQLLGAIVNLDQHRFKRMDYTYDLISGNVHRVDYETGNADQWHHAYNYDADNRITDVYTSTETPLLDVNSSIASLQNEPEINPMWEQEASYEYYAHGPLARTTLGEQEVQGIDYVYTLQGWIKGVNSNSLDKDRDPGKDGVAGLDPDHQLVAVDVYGYSLHYFDGDFGPIVSGNSEFIAEQAGSNMMNPSYSSDLYNGNIARMVSTITDPNSRNVLPLGNTYRYDQLNRLKESHSFINLDLRHNLWESGYPITRYYNSFTYDANGNILEQQRNDGGGTPIDALSYRYHTNLAGKRLSNRLYHVDDVVSSVTFSNDIDDMGTFDGTDNGINVNNNYVYDAEGRLVKDLQEEIDTIIWRVDGKVKSIQRPAYSEKKDVSFDYDAMGHRIAKHSITQNGLNLTSTYYILDAQGNTMSVYERKFVDNGTRDGLATFAQAEKHIYGSARLGIHTEQIPMLGSQNNSYTMDSVSHRIGERMYELSNHLGNVLSVISDKPLPHGSGGSTDNGTAVDYWLADIRQATDYSPFGVILSDRNLQKTIETCTEVTDTVTTTVLNEDFTSGGSWTKLSLTGTTLSYSSGEMVNTKTSTTLPPLPVGAYKDFTAPGSGDYTISIDVVSNTCGYPIILSIKDNVGTVIATQNCTTTGTHSLDFNLSGSGTYRVEIRKSVNAPCNYRVDNVIIVHKEITTDTICVETIADYRYSFQGQEHDDEIKGAGNSVNYTYRMHDPRLGRFFAIDPLAKNFCELTPYQFSSNSPIFMIELEGAEGKMYVVTKYHTNNGIHKSKIQVYVVEGLKADVIKTVWKAMDNPSGPAVRIDYHSRQENGTRGHGNSGYTPDAKPTVAELNKLFSADINNSYNIREQKKQEARLEQERIDNTPWYAGTIFADGGMEGGDDGANTGGEYGGEKGFYEKGIPLMAATAGTILTGGAGAGLFGGGFASTYVGSSLIGGTINAAGNVTGQYCATGNMGEVDGLSGVLSFGSSFIPGGNASRTFFMNVGISGIDAAFDVKLNGTVNTYGNGKTGAQITSDLFFGVVNAGTGGAVQASGAPNSVQNVRNFVVGGTTQYMNSKVNEKLGP